MVFFLVIIRWVGLFFIVVWEGCLKSKMFLVFNIIIFAVLIAVYNCYFLVLWFFFIMKFFFDLKYLIILYKNYKI